MGLPKKDEVNKSELDAEAASIEYSVKLAERMARKKDDEEVDEPDVKVRPNVSETADAAPIRKARKSAQPDDELAAEAASIEYSVKVAERMALNKDADDMVMPSGKTPANGQSGDDLASEVDEIESSVKEALDTDEEASVWPKLTGWTGKELRCQAKYNMYFICEYYPDEMKKLATEVIALGCDELDEKGARIFVNKVWKNKRLRENLQGAMNAMYYRELFDGDESCITKKSVPEIYLDGENPKIIFTKMKKFLFKNKDFPNKIYMVKNKRNRTRPLPQQLFEMFEQEKSRAAKRMGRGFVVQPDI